MKKLILLAGVILSAVALAQGAQFPLKNQVSSGSGGGGGSGPQSATSYTATINADGGAFLMKQGATVVMDSDQGGNILLKADPVNFDLALDIYGHHWEFDQSFINLPGYFSLPNDGYIGTDGIDSIQIHTNGATQYDYRLGPSLKIPGIIKAAGSGSNTPITLIPQGDAGVVVAGNLFMDGGLFATGTYPAASTYNSMEELYNTASAVTTSSAHPRVLSLRRGPQNTGVGAATDFGDPYIQVGGLEYTGLGDVYSIGFGYNGGGSSYSPVEIGSRTTNVSAGENAAFVVATRSDTGNTKASERLSVESTGHVLIGTQTHDIGINSLQVDGGIAEFDGVSPVPAMHSALSTAQQSYESVSDAGTTGVFSYTFATAFSAPPVCSCSVEASVLPCALAKTASGASCTCTTAGSAVVDLICFGPK